MAPKQSAVTATAWLDALALKSALNDYKVERVLGSGGFGIVYLARHVDLNRHVAIKEYLPTVWAVRDGLAVNARGVKYRALFEEGLTRFRDEARRLVELDEHPAVVSCHDFFRANGTAYLVMEYAEGEPLSEVLRTREKAGRPFRQMDLLGVIIPLVEGLAQVHASGVIHRDIKPSNIMIRTRDGQPVLIDFGAAKHGVAELTKSEAPYTPGYAAFEQVGDGKLGPWTDIYALGAVMWRMVAGGNPPCEPLHPSKAESRILAQTGGDFDPLPSASALGGGRFSAGVLTVIENCMRLQGKDRIQDCGELSRILRRLGECANDDGVSNGGGEVAAMCQRAVTQGHAWAQYSLACMYASGDGVPQEDLEAAALYRRAADQGHPEAQCNLGSAYFYGRGVPQDHNCAEWWYRKAADQGNANGQFRLGRVLYSATTWDVAPATWFRKAADQGHAEAQHDLGNAYQRGYGVPKDYGEAAAWFRRAVESFRKASDRGHADAQNSLGEMYEHGRGVSQDYREAVAWYRRAANQDDADAQNNLGDMYEHGRGVSQDAKAAVVWWRKAADQGHVFAQVSLGLAYMSGNGVPIDHEEAAAWLRKAADLGDELGQAFLAEMFVEDTASPWDDVEYAVCCRKAADMDENPEMQYRLGLIYNTGRGVSRNHGKAAAWYRMAADQGHVEAQYNLGNLYFDGEGVPQNCVRACAWWNIAAAQGDEEASRKMDRVIGRMTPEELGEMQRLSNEFTPKLR